MHVSSAARASAPSRTSGGSNAPNHRSGTARFCGRRGARCGSSRQTQLIAEIAREMAAVRRPRALHGGERGGHLLRGSRPGSRRPAGGSAGSARGRAWRRRGARRECGRSLRFRRGRGLPSALPRPAQATGPPAGRPARHGYVNKTGPLDPAAKIPTSLLGGGAQTGPPTRISGPAAATAAPARPLEEGFGRDSQCCVQQPVSPGLRPSGAAPGADRQERRRRLPSLQHRAGRRRPAAHHAGRRGLRARGPERDGRGQAARDPRQAERNR